MEQFSDKEIELMTEYPNLFDQFTKTMKLAYWFLAISLGAWVIGGIYAFFVLTQF
jgi:hypothetical protein